MRIDKKTGNLIGIGVFALGVLAVLAVGLLAYNRLMPGSRISVYGIPSQAVSAQDKRSIRDARFMAGQWGADFDQSQASLILKDGAFQLLYWSKAKPAEISYSRGIYQYDAETKRLTLTPQSKFGPPTDAQGVDYSLLTLRPYMMEIASSGADRVQWTPAGKNKTHPLFLYLEDSRAPIIWARVKE